MRFSERSQPIEGFNRWTGDRCVATACFAIFFDASIANQKTNFYSSLSCSHKMSQIFKTYHVFILKVLISNQFLCDIHVLTDVFTVNLKRSFLDANRTRFLFSIRAMGSGSRFFKGRCLVAYLVNSICDLQKNNIYLFTFDWCCCDYVHTFLYMIKSCTDGGLFLMI